MPRTGIVRDKRFMDHRPGEAHPESHRRLEAIYSMLEEPEMVGEFVEIPARRAEREELLLIHSPEYIDMVAKTEGKDHRQLDPDTATSPGSYEAALLAAGSVCRAVSMVISGELDNAFALVRPPGHHAERDRAMGFCLFNNVAVGARYAREVHNLKRVLIVDWDLHHGNGTQHSFEEDPSVLYFSTHQYPYYPGSGDSNEVGREKGAGFTVNVPLKTGYGDADYLGVFDRVLKPIAGQFDPELILVSAGFDIHEDDPLGGMLVTSKGFAGLMRSIMDIAGAHCGGKVVITLEGGYNLRGLRDSVRLVLRELADLSKTDYAEVLSRGDQNRIDYAVKAALQSHEGFWRSLKP